ncbi:MAG: hypothetical protein JWP89_2638 [Schlesneria sp.]|nr:hypothetical protein [Schlesneria sp.]
MAQFRIKPNSKRKAKADMEAFAKRKKQALKKALGFWMGDTVGEMQDELVRIGANDTGQLIAATKHDPVREEGHRISARGYNDSEHAPVIEHGRSPHSGLPPPLLPLVAWASRKGIISSLPVNVSFDGELAEKWAASGSILRNMKKGGAKKANTKPLDPQIRDLLIVRLIARKIFEKGIVGRHPFSIVWDRRSRTINKDIASLLRLLP